MAGLSAGWGSSRGPATPFGSLSARGPYQPGVATSVSNAGRSYPTAASWSPWSGKVLGLEEGTKEYADAAAGLNQTYAQGDIQRGMQQGQQSYERSMREQQRGWQLEDQGTALGLFENTMGGAGTPARVTGDDSAWDAMLAAQMGKAKDTAAAAVGAARKGMMDNMARRGISGSGIEAKQDMGIQLAGAGQIGAAGRENAIQRARRTADVSDRNYAGDITQRGQDITAQGQKLSLMPSIFSLLRAGVSY